MPLPIARRALKRALKNNFQCGATRYVFLLQDVAIKIPSFDSWMQFLHGLLGNMRERRFWRFTQDDRLCPVTASCPLGFWVVMIRCQPFSEDDWRKYQPHKALKPCDDDGYVLDQLVEDKPSSFGWMGNRIVAIDYGNL